MKLKSLLLSVFFGTCVSVSSALAGDLSEILKSGEVKIAVPEAFAPFGSVGKSGEHEGYDVDVAKLIAKDLGVKLKLVPVVSKQRIPFLETNKVDLVISTMGANPKRAKSINFSSAYAPFYSGVFLAVCQQRVTRVLECGLSTELSVNLGLQLGPWPSLRVL